MFYMGVQQQTKGPTSVQKQRPVRKMLTFNKKNILYSTLVNIEPFTPPTYKIGLMKQFVKALPKDGECFKYLCKKFPCLSEV